MRVQEVHNREGDSPLHTAIRDDNNDLVKKLLKKKSDLCIKNAAGITPLHLICALGRDKLLTNVLAYAKKQIAKNSEDNQYTKIDLTVQDNQGNTPLHYAMIQPTDHILAIIKRFDSRNQLRLKYNQSSEKNRVTCCSREPERNGMPFASAMVSNDGNYSQSTRSIGTDRVAFCCIDR